MQVRAAQHLLAAGVILLSACASGRARPEPPPMPEGVFRVSGEVGGKLIQGTLELDADYVVLDSNLGRCGLVARDIREQVRQGARARLGFTCGVGVQLEWDAAGRVRATASTQVVEQRTRQGECLSWYPAQPGASPRCTAYRQYVDTSTRTVTATLQLERVQEGAGGAH